MDFSIIVSDFAALTLDGLVVGAIYALVALGYTLVYGVLRLINFAHSEIFMLGTMSAVAVTTLLGFTGYEDPLPTFRFFAIFLLIAFTASIIDRIVVISLKHGITIDSFMTRYAIKFEEYERVRE